MGWVEALTDSGGGGVGGDTPSPLRKGSGKGAVPRKFFVFFLKILYFDAF